MQENISSTDSRWKRTAAGRCRWGKMLINFCFVQRAIEFVNTVAKYLGRQQPHNNSAAEVAPRRSGFVYAKRTWLASGCGPLTLHATTLHNALPNHGNDIKVGLTQTPSRRSSRRRLPLMCRGDCEEWKRKRCVVAHSTRINNTSRVRSGVVVSPSGVPVTKRDST